MPPKKRSKNTRARMRKYDDNNENPTNWFGPLAHRPGEENNALEPATTMIQSSSHWDSVATDWNPQESSSNWDSVTDWTPQKSSSNWDSVTDWTPQKSSSNWDPVAADWNPQESVEKPASTWASVAGDWIPKDSVQKSSHGQKSVASGWIPKDSAQKSSSDWNSVTTDWIPKGSLQKSPSPGAPVWETRSTEQPIDLSQLSIDDKVEKACKGWPWTEDPTKALCLGPFIHNPYYVDNDPMKPRFYYDTVRQKSLLFKTVLFNDIVTSKILGLVAAQYQPLWHFSSTCQEAWGIVVQNMGLWITNDNVYNMCNLKPEHVALLEARMWANYESDCNREALAGNPAPPLPYFPSPSVRPILVVTPMRCLDDPTMHSSTYQKDVTELNHLCRAIYNFGEFVKNIQFHRTPFLTIDMLAVFVPTMRNLTSLGVQKCQLIHIGDGLRLLEIIRTDRPKGKEYSIDLDWYPNFHKGPPSGEISDYNQGSYGVTWDNWNGDTILGTWRLVQRIVLKARKQGVDFESKYTSFRKWLDDGPCWRVDQTMKALLDVNIVLKEPVKVCALVSAHDPNHFGNPHKFVQPLLHQPEGWEWKVKRHHCSICKTQPMGIFFPYQEIYARVCDSTYPTQCCACKLVHVLETENDHYKDAKRKLIRELLLEQPLDGEDEDPDYQPQLNSTDLGKVLETFEETDENGHSCILSLARGIQLRREKVIANPKFGNDRETHDRQRKLTKREQMTMYATQYRSPTVYYKFSDPVVRGIREGEWDWNSIDASRSFHNRHQAW